MKIIKPEKKSSARIKEIQYTFEFYPSDHYNTKNIDEMVFEILSDPKKSKKSLSLEQYEIYEKVFLFVEHSEDDYVCKTIDVVSWISDFNYDKDDNVVLIGFKTSRNIEISDVESIYKNILIPIIQQLDIETKPTGEFDIYKIVEHSITATYSI